MCERLAEELEAAFDALSDDQLRMLKTFQELAVPHLVVGGFAVRVHAHLRAVEDLDLLVDTSEESLSTLFAALTRLGVHNAGEVIALFGRSSGARWGWVEGHIDLLTRVHDYRFRDAVQDVVVVMNNRRLLTDC